MESRHRPRPSRLPFRAAVQLFDGATTLPAEVFNLSEGGVFVAVEPTIPIGKGVSFWLPIAGEQLQIRGHVRWTRSIAASDTAPVGSGIEFYDPDGTLAGAVRAALALLP